MSNYKQYPSKDELPDDDRAEMNIEQAKKNTWPAKQYASAGIMLLADEIHEMRRDINHDDGDSQFREIRLEEIEHRRLMISYQERFGETHSATKES